MVRGTLTLRRQSIDTLGDYLQSVLDAAVVDETDLEGEYDFELTYQPGDPERRSGRLRLSAADDRPPS
jgi:uncharacterized protein (TIGR03435 family)